MHNLIEPPKLSPDNPAWKQDLAWFDGRIAELAKQ
jgi:hypothetical protein